MALKRVTVDGVGNLTVYKRKNAKNVRLSVKSDGSISVSIPAWAPYKLGIEFARKRSTWIDNKRFTPSCLYNGTRIGKAHTLQFLERQAGTLVATRLNGTDVNIYVPIGRHIEDAIVQKAAQTAAVRALKKEAQSLLPQRVAVLAKQHCFIYNSVQIKHLKSRWGSCSSQGDIVLNCFLMQLPWQLIDYVILHELMHTKQMSHGPSFWSKLSIYIDDLTSTRKLIRSYQPVLIQSNSSLK